MLSTPPFSQRTIAPLTSLLSVCISLAHSTKSNNDIIPTKVRSLSSKLLQLITSKLLKYSLQNVSSATALEAESDVNEGVSVMMDTLFRDDYLLCNAVALEEFCRNFLKQAMTYKPELQIASVLGQQNTFRSSRIKHPLFKVLFKVRLHI